MHRFVNALSCTFPALRATPLLRYKTPLAANEDSRGRTVNLSPHVILSRQRRSRSSLGVLRAPLLTLTLATLVSPAIAHENPGAVQPDGRFTPNVEGAQFPPQQRDIDNVRQFSPQAEEGGPLSTLIAEPPRAVTQGRTGRAVVNQTRTGASPTVTSAEDDVGAARRDATQIAFRNADVQRALGQRYSVLDSVRVRDKSSRDKDRFRVTFFSQDNNRTITVITAGGRVESLTTEAASEQQQPLVEDEMARAIELARQHWNARGVTRVDDLTGYAIQTFESDGTPYANRVAYVSFHTDSPEPPEFLTWVDLTNERVFRAEVAQ